MQQKERHYLEEFLNHLKLNPSQFAQSLGFERADRIYHVLKGRNDVSHDLAKIIMEKYPNVNYDWLMLGRGNMLLHVPSGHSSARNLIPFYDDVSTIGGTESVAATSGVTHPTDFIDTGDWFTDATAAIRHYGDSMIEYPAGCILALKEVIDRDLIIPGRDYCIETSEYRVTKRIQKGSDKNHWTAYSTNPSTYADGRLIHEPFEINKNLIGRIFLVLGYVVKKNGGTMVYSKKAK